MPFHTPVRGARPREQKRVMSNFTHESCFEGAAGRPGLVSLQMHHSPSDMASSACPPQMVLGLWVRFRGFEFYVLSSLVTFISSLIFLSLPHRGVTTHTHGIPIEVQARQGQRDDGFPFIADAGPSPKSVFLVPTSSSAQWDGFWT